MAGSTSATLNDLLPSIVAEAMFVAQERSIMRNLVKNYTVAPGQGKTVTVPIYPIQTAATLTEGNEFDNTAVSTDQGLLTVSQVGIRSLVTDLAVNASASNVVADLGQLFGNAVARKMDQDLLAQVKNFTTNTVGSSSTTVTAALVFQAITKLRNNGVPTEGMAVVLHPSVAYDLKAALTTNGNVAFTAGAFGDVANAAMVDGYIGRLLGVPVFETANAVLDNGGGAGDYVGGVFHRDALGLAVMRDINVETQRRASFLGTDVVASAMYGVGTIYEQYGTSIYSDSSVL